MRIIWKQWGQQRFSYNSNIRVVTEFWFRFVFFCFFDRFWSLLLTYSREFLRRLITNRQRKSCRTIRLLSTLYYCKRLAILYIQSDMRERFYNSDRVSPAHSQPSWNYLTIGIVLSLEQASKFTLFNSWNFSNLMQTCSFDQWVFFDL